MEQEVLATEQSLMAGAVAIGAVSAIGATILLFPLIDRFVRERFQIARGGAMLLLLGLSLTIGTVAGAWGYFWLKEREAESVRESPPARAGDANSTSSP
jgi:hypothetical protein